MSGASGRCPLAIIGPTASGKSALAHAAAAALDGVEIVSVDAMQVYRGLDIGTAKPSPVEQLAVHYHCIDLVDPSETFSVADYVVASRRARDDIAARGATPLLVGGTGLYLRSVTDHLELAGSWPELRAELETDADEDVAAEYARLQTLDPVAAARIEPGNRRRIVRALEVCLGSGRPFSSFGPGLATYDDPLVEQVGLRWDRATLAARIEGRVASMMTAGLLDEVRALLSRGPDGLSRTARQALGYKELIDHLEGRSDLDEAVATIIRRTRQFAVRQDRWFRRDPRVRWLDIEADPVAEVLPVVMETLTR